MIRTAQRFAIVLIAPFLLVFLLPPTTNALSFYLQVGSIQCFQAIVAQGSTAYGTYLVAPNANEKSMSQPLIKMEVDLLVYQVIEGKRRPVGPGGMGSSESNENNEGLLTDSDLIMAMNAELDANNMHKTHPATNSTTLSKGGKLPSLIRSRRSKTKYYEILRKRAIGSGKFSFVGGIRDHSEIISDDESGDGNSQRQQQHLSPTPSDKNEHRHSNDNEWTSYQDMALSRAEMAEDVKYKLCLLGARAKRNAHYSVVVTKAHEDATKRLVSIDLTVGGAASKNYTLIQQDENLSELELELRKLEDELRDLSIQLALANERSEQMRQLHDNTKKKVVYTSILSCVVLLAAGLFQALHLQNYFKKIKMI